MSSSDVLYYNSYIIYIYIRWNMSNGKPSSMYNNVNNKNEWMNAKMKSDSHHFRQIVNEKIYLSYKSQHINI